MFSVNTNLGALAALQSLANTQSQLTMTQNRISTGQKVSQASDSPAIYAIAQTMNGTISGLAAVSDNLNFAQSVISTASSAATQISSQLASLKNTVTQGQQVGIDSTTINNQIKSILSNIDGFASAATFNGVNIAGGTGSAVTSSRLSTTKDVSGTPLVVTQQNMTSSGLGLPGLAVSSGGFAISTNSSTAFATDDNITLTGADATGAAYNWHFVLTDGSGTPTAPTTSDATNKIIFVNYDSTNDSTAAVLSKLSTAMQKEGFGATMAASSGPLDSSNAPVYGAGNLVITGNGITATDTTGVTASGVAQSAVTGSEAAIATVDAAIASLNGKIATLGQNSQQVTGLQSFTSALSSSLTSGLGALTDADMSAESAKLQSLQTKQQLGIQALSIANQQPQALLSLFR